MTKYIKTLIAIITVLAVACLPAMASAQATTNHWPHTQKYVSLGDSIAAGAGLPLLDNSPESQACARSGQAYPQLVAAKLKAEHTQIACSGASLPSGVLGPQTVGSLTLPAQIDRAFANGQPDIITLTVGTNDVHWADFLRKCYAATCGTAEDSQNANGLILNMYQNLRTALDTIDQKSGYKQPKVVVTGYFQPLSNDNAACVDTQGLSSDEISWIRWQVTKINAAIRVATWGSDSAQYASIDFTGHELCSATPWLQGLADPASYHPNAAGQAAIGDAVLQKLGY
jgi:lysophospholipase L1-like esterase